MIGNNSAPGRSGSAIRAMFDEIAPTYDRLNHLLSAGTDRRWRERAVRELPPNSLSILDLCAGTLDFAQAARRVRPETLVVGTDFSFEMLRAGRDKATSVQLAAADALALPFGDCVFDAVLCGFGVRNVVNLSTCLHEVRRVLRPGGVFVVLEFFRAERIVTRVFHGLYNRRVIPAVGGLVSGNGEAYKYLAKSMERFVTRTEMEQLFSSHGFVDVRGLDLTLGVASIVRGART